MTHLQERSTVMNKWLMLAIVCLMVALVAGCKTETGSAGMGEKHGRLTRDDFNPFGRGRAPVDLAYFTAPHDGRYRVTMASGTGEDPLRNPQIWIMRGRVPQDADRFLRAFDRGRGVVFQDDGEAIANVVFPATGGDNFTIAFTSRTDSMGAYNYDIGAIRGGPGGGGPGGHGGPPPPHH
jgi:hypothetical protein